MMKNRMVERNILVAWAAFMAISCAGCVFLCGESGAKQKWERSKDGLKALMELAKDRGKMEKDYKAETSDYDKIKKAVDNDALEKGWQSFEVEKKFGEPVVILPDGGGERWVYKPATGSFLDNVPKVYLFFDTEKKLSSWKAVEAKPEAGRSEAQDS